VRPDSFVLVTYFGRMTYRSLNLVALRYI
jgi:hypothetical protein